MLNIKPNIENNIAKRTHRHTIAPTIVNIIPIIKISFCVEALRFELKLTEPKSVVLPLHHTSVNITSVF